MKETERHNEHVDIIERLIDQSKDSSVKYNDRVDYLHNAFDICYKLNIDSLRAIELYRISKESLKFGDSSFFKLVNKEAEILATRLKDTFLVANIDWNFGAYYFQYEILDSAYIYYNKAYRGFESIDHSFNTARMLYNMAVIQKDIKNYTGSEVLIFQAIKKLEKLDKPLNLYFCYNLLAVIFNEMEEYQKAIQYHEKALGHLNKVKNKGTFREGNYNNLGLVYRNLKQYDQSILMFEKGLASQNLRTENKYLYARLLDNLAYSKFLNGDSIDLEPMFNQALAIRDSLNNNFGVSISKLHLAEYFLSKKDSLNAIKNAKEANELAINVENNKIILESFELLSELDEENGTDYLRQFIELNQTLQNRERKQRNKFTRIRYETDEYIERTERLDSEKSLIAVGSLFLISVIVVMYLIKIQINRNKEFLFEKKQQKANEEIYSLMLRQQVRLEEGKHNERNRIAEELHDGVLGRFFGTRMGLGFLALKGDEQNLKEFRKFKKELQSIEKEIRDISHELRTDGFSNQFNFMILIEDLIKDQSKIGKFKYSVKIDDRISWDNINENIKINCYRILQEAIFNVNKHANAKNILIEFKIENSYLILTIDDDGIGFNKKKKTNGIGLKNIRMRSNNMKAKFSLKTKLTKGSSIIISIPI